MKSMHQVTSKSSVSFWCSTRVAIVFIVFFGMIIHSSQRTNLSIGVVCMVNHSAVDHQYANEKQTVSIPASSNCPRTNGTTSLEGSFVWSKNIQGIILGAYFWGYIVTQIPGGYLAGRFGARFILTGAIFISSLVTMFMPLAAKLHWISLCILEIIVGLAHGFIWPCVNVIMAHWVPTNERGRLFGFINAGAQIGNGLALSVGGLLCSWHVADGSPLIFYSAGIMGLIWSIVWMLFYTNSPRRHRLISTKEKEFILKNTEQYLSNKDNKHHFHAPWIAILTSPVCWALFVIHTCSNYGTYTFLTSAPKYLSEVLKFDIESNGLLSAVPYIFLSLITNFSGFLADILVRKKILSITKTRKLFDVLGTLPSALFVISLVFMTCHTKYTAVILLTIGIAFGGFCFGGGFALVANDIAPAYAGVIYGISNTFATIPGIVSPYVVGALTERNPNNWHYIFFICAAIYFIGMMASVLFGSSKLQPWAVKHTNIASVSVNLLPKEHDGTSAVLTHET